MAAPAGARWGGGVGGWGVGAAPQGMAPPSCVAGEASSAVIEARSVLNWRGSGWGTSQRQRGARAGQQSSGVQAGGQRRSSRLAPRPLLRPPPPPPRQLSTSCSLPTRLTHARAPPPRHHLAPPSCTMGQIISVVVAPVGAAYVVGPPAVLMLGLTAASLVWTITGGTQGGVIATPDMLSGGGAGGGRNTLGPRQAPPPPPHQLGLHARVLDAWRGGGGQPSKTCGRAPTALPLAAGISTALCLLCFALYVYTTSWRNMEVYFSYTPWLRMQAPMQAGGGAWCRRGGGRGSMVSAGCALSRLARTSDHRPRHGHPPMHARRQPRAAASTQRGAPSLVGGDAVCVSRSWCACVCVRGSPCAHQRGGGGGRGVPPPPPHRTPPPPCRPAPHAQMPLL